MLVWLCSLMLTLGWTHDIKSDIGYNNNYGNSSYNVCLKENNEKKFTDVKPEIPKTKELMKLKFHERAQISDPKCNNYLDDPNSKQVLLSKALIENANYVFDKMYNMDPSFIIEKSSSGLVKYPIFKLDHKKGVHGSWRRKRADPGFEPASIDYIGESRDDGENEPSSKLGKRKKFRPREYPEMRVHCIRSGPNEVVCKHDNFSFCFKLPQELFKKDIMEKLVSSVCSIVEEAIPEGVSNPGSLVDIAVSKVQPKIQDDRSDYLSKKRYNDRETPKVIRINIPIDFSAIPLNNEEMDERNIDKLERPSEDSLLDPEQDNFILPTEKPKFKQFKIDDSYLNLLQQNQDNGAMKRADNRDHFINRPDVPEKWINKRENLKNPMVFPPSLILLKRNVNADDNTSCKREKFKDICLKTLNNTSPLLT